jgi:hypothetical protein
MTVEHRRCNNIFNDLQQMEHEPEMDEDEDPEVTVRMFFDQPNVQQLQGDLAEQMAARIAHISTRIENAVWSNELHHDLVEHIYENYEKD